MWQLVAATLASAAAGAYGTSQATKASEKGQKQAINEQRRQYDTTLALLEPQRALGYGGLSDLATLYGYRLPAYTAYNDLVGGTAGSGTSTVKGQEGKSPDWSFGMIGGQSKKYGGNINYDTGTVTIANHPFASAAATEYLRTGRLPGKHNGLLKRITAEIDNARGAGYTYDPNAPAPQPTAGPVAPTTNTGGTSPDGTAGNFSRFFTSPDYQFRLGEGTKAIEQSAAARGGAMSGNAVKAATEYASNLASGEYGNYVNRLLAMAGLNQTATNGAIAAGTNAANNISNAITNAADTRASGVIGMTNTVTGAINSGVNNYLLWKLLNQGGGSGGGYVVGDGGP